MLIMRYISRLLLASCVLATSIFAHPGSGIVVDRRGHVFFVDTGSGVWQIDREGRLARHEGPAFHWMAIDPAGRFAATRFPAIPQAELKAVGRDPTLILSSDFPLVVASDGALCYPELGQDARVQIVRLAADGTRTTLAKLPEATASGPLRWLNGMAAGRDGSFYYSENAAIRKIAKDGTITTIAENVTVPDCTMVPSYDQARAEERLGPHLRGLDVTPDGTVFVAATGCAAVLRITSKGEVTAVVRATSPWSPTGVAVAGTDVYVLEYLHTASDDRREWLPRVRKLAADGKVTLVAAVEREQGK